VAESSAAGEGGNAVRRRTVVGKVGSQGSLDGEKLGKRRLKGVIVRSR
jgi:hypothetical protein